MGQYEKTIYHEPSADYPDPKELELRPGIRRLLEARLKQYVEATMAERDAKTLKNKLQAEIVELFETEGVQPDGLKLWQIIPFRFGYSTSANISEAKLLELGVDPAILAQAKTPKKSDKLSIYPLFEKETK